MIDLIVITLKRATWTNNDSIKVNNFSISIYIKKIVILIEKNINYNNIIIQEKLKIEKILRK